MLVLCIVPQPNSQPIFKKQHMKFLPLKPEKCLTNLKTNTQHSLHKQHFISLTKIHQQ